MLTSGDGSVAGQHRIIKTYYRQQAKIYEATRWSFLFGRKDIVKSLHNYFPDAEKILEVGCGTGYNLKRLAKTFPHAYITGVDLSPDMVRKAEEKTIRFQNRINVYETPFLYDGPHTEGIWDIILFSYSLSMINPQWPAWMDNAKKLLQPSGVIGVVDFHNSKFNWFANHMKKNHVVMEGHLLKGLNNRFEPHIASVKPAYSGVWNYFSYIGLKSGA